MQTNVGCCTEDYGKDAASRLWSWETWVNDVLADRFSRSEGPFGHHSGKPLLHTSNHLRRTSEFSNWIEALCLDIVIPGILRVPIKMIVIDGELRDIIHDNWVYRPAIPSRGKPLYPCRLSLYRPQLPPDPGMSSALVRMTHGWCIWPGSPWPFHPGARCGFRRKHWIRNAATTIASGSSQPWFSLNKPL